VTAPEQGVNDAVWLAQLRWTMEHLEHRYDSAGAAAWALVGFEGVFAALVAPLAVDFTGAARWLAFAVIVLVGVAAGAVLRGMWPRGVPSINVARYRELWAEEWSSEVPTDRLEGHFVEELLQSGGEPSPLNSMTQLAERRFAAVKQAAGLTMCSIVLLVVSVLIEIVT